MSECYLVVIDPTSDDQPALDRAILSAQIEPKRIHLFKSVYFHHGELLDGDEQQRKQKILERFTFQLDAFSKRVSDLNLQVSTQLVWSQHWGEAVIAAVRDAGAYMVFNSSTIHTGAERSINTADWTLMRECDCPVMLIHNESAWQSRTILAAVNLAAQDKEHVELNQKIIATALDYREQYKSDVHFINALPIADNKVDVADVADDGDLLLINVWPQTQDTQQPAKKNIDMAYVAKQCQVDREHIHLPSGFSNEMILQTAEKIDASLIIIGTVARKGIKGRILGNTAEKLLDRTRCDILTLKSLC